MATAATRFNLSAAIAWSSTPTGTSSRSSIPWSAARVPSLRLPEGQKLSAKGLFKRYLSTFGSQSAICGHTSSASRHRIWITM